jgi:Gram-negative bacterial TonB protein C-terminal
MRWIKGVWKKLSHDGKVASVIALAALIIGIFAIPGVLEHKSEENKPEKTPSSRDDQPKQREPSPTNPNDNPPPGKPRLRYVPLPNAVPLQEPKTYVTSIPKEGEKLQTVNLYGQDVPVMSQEDLDKVLAYKVPFSQFVRVDRGPTDVLLSIGKDGKVDDVAVVSGDKSKQEKLRSVLMQWQFKPFVKDGQDVPVQTVIQLTPGMTSEMLKDKQDHQKQ